MFLTFYLNFAVAEQIAWIALDFSETAESSGILETFQNVETFEFAVAIFEYILWLIVLFCMTMKNRENGRDAATRRKDPKVNK